MRPRSKIPLVNEMNRPVVMQEPHGENHDPIPHDFALDEDGEVDLFAMHSSFHNGPRCLRCDVTFCKHCHPEQMTEPCPSPLNQPL